MNRSRARKLLAALTIAVAAAAVFETFLAVPASAECYPEVVWNGERLVNTGRVNCSLDLNAGAASYLNSDPCRWYPSYCAQLAAYYAYQEQQRRAEALRFARDSALFRVKNGQACNDLLSGPNGRASDVLQSIVDGGRINANGGVYVSPSTGQSRPDTVASFSGQGASGSILSICFDVHV